MFFFFVKFLLNLQEQNQSQLIQKKKKTIRNLPSWPGNAGWVYIQLLQVATKLFHIYHVPL